MITVVPPSCAVFTVCSGVDLRVPAACAFARRDWTVLRTAAWSARKASPRFCVQVRLSFIWPSTWGTAVSAFTAGSHFCFCIASSSALPVTFGFAFDHRAASTISRGYVAPIRIWAISASG